MRWLLLRLWVGIWLHIHIVTTTDTSPDMWEWAEIQPYASVQTMPLHFDWGCRTFQTASHVHAIHIQEVWAPSQVVGGHMASHSHRYHHRHFPRFGKDCWNPTWCKCAPCYYALAKAVEPFKLHSMSMSYIYEVFKCLLRLWMGIWLHNHTIITTDVSPDVWELAEILPDASVQTMPLCFEWGCRTFQTAFHVHVIYIWGVWAPSQVVDGHMISNSYRYHHRHFPRFVRVDCNPTWCKCANHATTLWLSL